jgi:hypothetical protein
MAKHRRALPRARMTPLILAAIAALTAELLVAVLLPNRAGAAATVTYSATQTIPVPPASTYAGSGGGDGWGIALSSEAVYNVFHHAGQLTVACHLQSDASPCWAPETITDPASGAGFATSGHPGLWLDPAIGKLYVYATRTDSTGGVVCVDTTQAAANPDPFCGFTALTAVGDAPDAGISALSEPAQVSGRWYAFNYVSGATMSSGAGSDQNTLLCFDLSTKAACGAQPYPVTLDGSGLTTGTFPEPQVATIGGLVVIASSDASGDQLGCFDSALGHACTGSWPVTLPASSYTSSFGAPYPLLSATGAFTGFCLPTGTDPCYDLSGSSVPTPAGMPAAIPGTSGWNGHALTLGPRVYVPNGNSNAVDCYDAATGASCVNFPRPMTNAYLLYTVNPDPARPTCLWTNADSGAGQIQNFDAYTGGACGQGPIRVLASSFVVGSSLCQPATYTSLQVTDPPRGSYGSGTVQFQDGDATPIPGLSDGTLDGTGTVSLTGLNLSTATGLPQFLITLTGATGTPGSVTVKLTWTGTDDPSCVKPGTTVTGGSGGPSACGNTVVIAAIGSGQVWKSDNQLTGVSPQLDYLYQNILKTAGSKTVGLRVLNYPADSVNVLFAGLGDVTGRNAADYAENVIQKLKSNAATYLAGEKQGLAQMWGQFTSVRVGCPAGTKIILAGYSQGSMVVHEFLNGLAATNDAAGKRAIIGSALLADPERVPKSTVLELSDAPFNSYGICDLRLTKLVTSCTEPDPLTDIQPPFNSGAISVCSWDDPVCDTSDLVHQLPNWWNSGARNSAINLAMVTHDSYRYSPATKNAGLLLGHRVARN